MMRHRLRGARRRLSVARRDVLERFGPMPTDPVVVLGNQKSGTTAVARLLSSATGATYSHDMFYRRGWFDAVADLHRGRLPIDDLVGRHRWEFGRDIVKDPDLSFHVAAIREALPGARLVFVVRDPRGNIRSILNRLRVAGTDTDAQAAEVLERHNAIWRSVVDPSPLGLPGGSFVDVLAQRWTRAAEEYLAACQHVRLLRYEDFVRDKRGAIEELAGDVGLRVTHDVSGETDVQYQPAGDNSSGFADYFGAERLAAIERWTAGAAASLGYR